MLQFCSLYQSVAGGPFHRQLGLFAGLSLAGGLLGDELFLLVTDLIFKYHNQIKIMKK